MKKAVRVIFCFALAMFALAGGSSISRAQESSTTTDEQRTSRAVLPFYMFSFGDIIKGEPIIVIFPIKNIGDRELRIKDIIADCGCTVVRADMVIPPGKEGVARVQVDTRAQIGQIFKTSRLHTNDPEQPNITLTITANILSNPNGSPLTGVVARQGKHIGPIFLEPDEFISSMIAEGRKAKAEFTITVEQGSMKILRVESDRPEFAARLEAVEGGKKYKIVVESSAPMTPGTYDVKLTILSDSAIFKSYAVGFRVMVLPKQ